MDPLELARGGPEGQSVKTLIARDPDLDAVGALIMFSPRRIAVAFVSGVEEGLSFDARLLFHYAVRVARTGEPVTLTTIFDAACSEPERVRLAIHALTTDLAAMPPDPFAWRALFSRAA